jgi:hypothetical protein
MRCGPWFYSHRRKYPMRPLVLGGAAVYRCGNGLLFSKPLGAEENRCLAWPPALRQRANLVTMDLQAAHDPGRTEELRVRARKWSGRRDLNSRPLAPTGTCGNMRCGPWFYRHLRKYPMRPLVLGGAAVYRCGTGLLFSKPLGAEENRCLASGIATASQPCDDGLAGGP